MNTGQISVSYSFQIDSENNNMGEQGTLQNIMLGGGWLLEKKMKIEYLGKNNKTGEQG